MKHTTNKPKTDTKKISRTKFTPKLMKTLQKNLEMAQELLEMPETGPTSESKAILERAKAGMGMKEGGLAEATAKLKAKGMKEGGMVVKDKTVAIDKSPNSGLITTKGFGASRRT